jgi:hypothetical protein
MAALVGTAAAFLVMRQDWPGVSMIVVIAGSYAALLWTIENV